MVILQREQGMRKRSSGNIVNSSGQVARYERLTPNSGWKQHERDERKLQQHSHDDDLSERLPAERSESRSECPRLIAYQWKRIAESLIEPEFESMVADRQFGSDPLLVLFGARAVWATIWHSWLSLQLARRRFASPS